MDLSKLPPPAQKQIDFVRDVQPILSGRCYSCHGEDKQENELRWDTKSSALKGGTSGPAIIPGKSAESRMIHLVAGLEKNLVMPKKGERLTTEEIGLLRAWIDQGATWPDEAAQPKTNDKADWWSFKPASRPSLPSVKNKKWARNEIDLFILAKLKEQKLSPSPEADRRTLIRRLSFDLIGMPPTPEEVEQFARDKNPKSYENLVDRLLASPRYGERWARHWLDVVHFGETHGYDKDKPRLNAWPYRDYVIRSLNNDKPYSQFVEEQIAGDVLFPDSPDGIVALGFIAAGPWDFVGHVELPIEKSDGLIARYNDRDDMVMTTMSTFQSLTVHCARCHNHKFDPIQQKEYYGLQSVFAGVDRADRNFDTDKETILRRRSLKNEKSALENQFAALTNKISAISSPEIKQLDANTANGKQKLAALGKTDDAGKSPSNGYHSDIENTRDRMKWVQVDLGKTLPLEQIVLVPARPVDFPDAPGFGFPARFRVEISNDREFAGAEIIADQTIADFKNPGDKPVSFAANGKSARFIRITATLLWERTGDFVFALAELQVFVNGTNAAMGAEVTSLDSIEAGYWGKKFLVDGFDSRKKLADTLPDDPMRKQKEQLERELRDLAEKRKALVENLIEVSQRDQLNRTTNRLAEIDRELAALPPPQKVFAATSDFKPNGNFLPAKVPRPVYLLARGDVKQPRDLMVPAGIAAVPGADSDFHISDLNDEGLRRAALAKWITDPKNILTRRSIVNRVWHYHFGRGIVETPNDFGHMGALPTHPGLLDWLAYWFLDHGESLKQLHKLIVMSSTYRQSSANNPQYAHLDGDNRFLWRMNRQRLDAESVRDTILSVSGKLDPKMGGPSVQQFFFKDDHSPVYDYARFDVDSAGSYRRSIYRFIVRSVPDPFMDCLDSADASILTPKRNTTITALQALALLNDPFVLKQTEHFAERIAGMSNTLPGQIKAAYQLALNRPPRADESKLLVAYAQKHGLPNLCRLIFNSNEFLFID